ncbi:MAG: hypothetical protein VR78_05335 [Hoeflea sp. BRH_c9]|nr:MAG: hypothetical protein VR78_05335 [Hoeflea sp. BRH_c9]
MTSDGIMIEARGVSKSFDRGRGQLSRLWRTFAGTGAENAFWALRDVDLDVRGGEAIGIVGRNGSGKSTLLQILCGTMRPTSGTVKTRGRISAMLELGAGFNPAFTGRENVRLSAAAHGLDAPTIAARMDSIEEFADIGLYFDRPLHEYSSGMYARLAFAVSAHVDAAILIVDEILGVGDSAFQKKCQRFMHGFMNGGGTIVFVSHDPGAVTALCKRACWLEAGRKMEDGVATKVMKSYVDSIYSLSGPPDRTGDADAGEINDPAVGGQDPYWGASNRISISRFSGDAPRHGFGGCLIEDCFISSSGSTLCQSVTGGSPVTLHIRARATRRIDCPIAGFIFRQSDGQNLFGDNTYLTYKDNPLSVLPGQVFEAKLSFVMPYLPPGRYSIAPSIIEGTQHSHVHLDWREEALFLDVVSSPVRSGKVGLVMKSIYRGETDVDGAIAR